MNRRAAASADKLDLDSIEALLKTQASTYDDFLTTIITKTRDAEIDQEEISEILDRHLGCLQSLTRKAFPTSSLTPLQRNDLDPYRKSYVTPQSNRSLAQPAFQQANKKLGAQKGHFNLNEFVANSDGEKSDEDSLFVSASRNTARPDSSMNQNGSSSKHPNRPVVETPAPRKDLVDDTQNTSYSHSFGAFNAKAGINARGIVGGASQLFGKSRNGGKLHTPIKSRKHHAIDLDEDSENEEARDEFDLAVDSSDGEKNRGGRGSGSKRRKSSKSTKTGWMEPTVNVIHEAAKKRAQNYIGPENKSFKSDTSKKGKSNRKLSPSSSFNTSNGEGSSSSKKRSFPSLSHYHNDEDYHSDGSADSTPSKKKKRRSESGYRSDREEKMKKRKQEKKQKKEERKDKDKGDRKRDRQLEKERQATHSMESLNRKSVASDLNSMNKSSGATSQFVDLTLDSDDYDIMAAASIMSLGGFNNRAARSGGHDSDRKYDANVSFGEDVFLTVDSDTQSRFGSSDNEVAASLTSARRREKVRGVPLLDDGVAGGGFDRGTGDSIIVDVAAVTTEARRLMVEKEQQDDAIEDGYYHDADDDED